ncbi:MAG: polyprenyl synthetase family protein [Gammaproteobacteria bacterium]|nr:polyprenyl synthetase family protein [Gammaproteobacteria bacterium]
MERALERRLPAADVEPARLHAAMRYSVLGGGKRVRPMLLFCAARAVGLTEAEVEGAACAIELVHVYSLVHDDLPAIDNDDLRRGRLTCHKAYDQATAVLVGDALQSLAFQLLASDAALPSGTAARMRLIGLLADASGMRGMVGGQALDLEAQGRSLPVAELATMYRLKTGALIRASLLMGAACAPAVSPGLWNALANFAEAIGLAFQIQDDLLDELGVASTIGKTTGSDRARGKPTYPAVLGAAASQQRVRELHAEATEALRPFGASADALRALADWLLVRSY